MLLLTLKPINANFDPGEFGSTSDTVKYHLLPSFFSFIYLFFFLAVSVSFKGYHLFSVAAGDVKLNILLICVTGGISGSLVSGEVGVI